MTASDLVELAWKLEATAKALNANHGELLLCDLLREAASALRERIPLPADGGAREALDTYDAGLLNDWGGGNVEWWQDYIRAELGRAHDFYAAQFDRLALHPSSRGEAEQK